MNYQDVVLLFRRWQDTKVIKKVSNQRELHTTMPCLREGIILVLVICTLMPESTVPGQGPVGLVSSI